MVDWPPDRSQPPGTPAAGHEGPEFPGRRSFLGLLLGVGTLLVGALLSVPLFRFVLFPLFRTTTKTKWADIGPMSNFSALAGPVRKDINVEQVDAWRELYSQKSVFVIPWPNSNNGRVRVLSAVCPHLGCLVHFNKDKNEFLCPCHGSIFAADGKLVRGPAARGLDPLPHKIEQGNLMVLYEYFRELIAKREVIG
jgi:menaquinol-cytochrome c reductase iron-sulfur subunit